MSIIAGLVGVEKNYSYQHLQGVMLVNLNRQAFKLNLSHSAYRVMANLISFWNINTCSAFPSIEMLAKQCGISKRTVIRQLNTLKELGLILIINNPGQHNKYFFTKKLTGDILKPSTSDICRTVHNINKYKNKQKKSSHTKINPLINDKMKFTHNSKMICKINYLYHKRLYLKAVNQQLNLAVISKGLEKRSVWFSLFSLNKN